MDIRWTYGGHMAYIRQTYGKHTADMRQTYGGHTANIRRTYGEHTVKIRKHTANMRQKWLRTYGEHTADIRHYDFRFHPSIPLIPTYFISLFHAFVVQQPHHSHNLDTTHFYFMSIPLLVVL